MPDYVTIAALIVFFGIVLLVINRGGLLRKIRVGKLIEAEFDKDQRYRARIRLVLSRPKDVARLTVRVALDGKGVANLRVLEGQKEDDVEFVVAKFRIATHN